MKFSRTDFENAKETMANITACTVPCKLEKDKNDENTIWIESVSSRENTDCVLAFPCGCFRVIDERR